MADSGETGRGVYIRSTHRNDSHDNRFNDSEDRGDHRSNGVANGRDDGSLRYEERI
jgi:hypothetical protein